MSSAGSWRYSIWPCAEAFGSPTFCSIDYGPSLVNLRKFAEADLGSAREVPPESSDLPAVRISRPRAPGPGRCRSRPCRAAPQSAHGDELALSSLRPELQQSSPCASYETSQGHYVPPRRFPRQGGLLVCRDNAHRWSAAPRYAG